MTAAAPVVQCCSDLDANAVECLAHRYGVRVVRIVADAAIPGSFWGDPEAGIAGTRLYARPDTPVHSLLHELCHIVCMTPERRRAPGGNAGSDDLEEAAVCYLQVILADHLPGVGRQRLMHDMDAWGYSFRCGSTGQWFLEDAADARAWLVGQGLLSPAGEPVFRLRGT